MKKIFAITLRNIRIHFSSPSEWLFFLILPIVFTVVLAGGTAGFVGDSRVSLVVVDQAHSALSQELIEALEKSESVRPKLMDLESAEKKFDGRDLSVLLIIPAGFERAALESGGLTLELREQANNLNALIARQALHTILNQIGQSADIAQRSVTAAEALQPFPTEAERRAYFDAAQTEAQTLLAEAPLRIHETVGSTLDPIEYDPNANSSAGQLITWVFVPLIGISGLFAYERQTGTLRRVLTTPTRKGTYLFGTIFGQVLIGLAQMSLLVGFGILIMKVNWARDLPGLAILLTSAALAAAALGTMLGAFVKSPSQATWLSIMLGMVMALMGGCWYPLELFPATARAIVKVLPTTWAMQGMLDLILRGQPWTAILPEAGVLLGFAAVFFTIGIWRFRYE